MSASPQLRRHLDILCGFGGRRTGSASERQASAYIGEVLAGSGGRASWLDTPYAGWQPLECFVEAADSRFDACALLNVPATAEAGLRAGILDLGRGAPADFAARQDEVRGRIVLVRHERMFAPDTVHRRVKYAEAVRCGAAAMLVVGHQPGSVVAGSSGMEAGEGIPAAGIAPETAEALRRAGSARLLLRSALAPAEARSHFVEFGPEAGPVVVLSAHLDGHDPAESALDNATGCAILLALIDEVAGRRDLPCRLRFAFFNLEEWRLTGSREYVARLSPEERAEIVLNINLDSLGMAGPMTALTSGFEALGPFLQRVFAGLGEDLGVHLPLQTNSDHANFAEAGIPAFRLLSGFDDPESVAMKILSDGDRREAVSLPDLDRALGATRATMEAALRLSPQDLRPVR
ncbi:Zn-dependent M28 family amino/carboxypeptidase [Cereibacter changlensis]|uniref:Carboxypeptidase Q n=2 Tax=Cereibacter changlensis TaxID=402884 RepID=A0A2W7RZK7_9RHOB|nr:M28 family peptidase [Cereibacter changlensis]PZX56325.1 Zn-dependent M28 family amino/carboxypeptidase [Cereibacter changlensis]